MGYLYKACDQISAINSCWEKCAYMFNVTKNQQSRQTGSRNLMDPKTLPTIWGTYMKIVTKYQISAINSCWEKCDEKWAYMFNVCKNQQSRQTGSRNLKGPKTLPTIWYTYMMLVTKYQISAINSYWVKCNVNISGKNTYNLNPKEKNVTRISFKIPPMIIKQFIIPPFPKGGGGILFFIPPLPEGGGGYTVLRLSVCPSVRPRYFSLHFSQ
jgi:hypothetical protein